MKKMLNARSICCVVLWAQGTQDSTASLNGFGQTPSDIFLPQFIPGGINEVDDETGDGEYEDQCHQDPPCACLARDQFPCPVLGLGHEVPFRSRAVIVRVPLVIVRLPPHYRLGVLFSSLKWIQAIMVSKF